MKKETIITAITAIVFFSVGFLTGYVYNAGQSPIAGVAPSGATGGAAQDSAVNSDLGLPPGHPPIDNSAAIHALEEEASQDPRDPKPPLKLANLFYDQKRFDQAVEWYEKALALDPKNVNALTDLGTAYYNLGRPQDAIREYKKSLEINPDHEPTMFNLIVVNLGGAHNLAAARAAWDKLHARDPNYPGLDRLKQALDSAGAPTRP